MGFLRHRTPGLLTGDELTSAMVGIGMLFSTPGNSDADIEDTLLSASMEGMEQNDLRVLSMLVTWFEAHSARVNADRLFRAVCQVESPRTRAFWSAVAIWLQDDRRFARLKGRHTGKRIDLLEGRSRLLFQRHGEDLRFADGPLAVPGNVLRDRKVDIATAAQLAVRHRVYRWRLIIGPSYRADVWATLEDDPTLSVSELARRVRCSIGTASQVRRDYQALAAASPPYPSTTSAEASGASSSSGRRRQPGVALEPDTSLSESAADDLAVPRTVVF